MFLSMAIKRLVESSVRQAWSMSDDLDAGIRGEWQGWSHYLAWLRRGEHRWQTPRSPDAFPLIGAPLVNIALDEQGLTTHGV